MPSVKMTRAYHQQLTAVDRYEIGRNITKNQEAKPSLSVGCEGLAESAAPATDTERVPEVCQAGDRCLIKEVDHSEWLAVGEGARTDQSMGVEASEDKVSNLRVARTDEAPGSSGRLPAISVMRQ